MTGHIDPSERLLGRLEGMSRAIEIVDECTASLFAVDWPPPGADAADQLVALRNAFGLALVDMALAVEKLRAQAREYANDPAAWAAATWPAVTH